MNNKLEEIFHSKEPDKDSIHYVMKKSCSSSSTLDELNTIAHYCILHPWSLFGRTIMYNIERNPSADEPLVLKIRARHFLNWHTST